MANIPNTSKSPYYLERLEGRGDASPRSEYSLRSIPAWDPGYLGSSLLAKRIRKTLVAVEDRINAIATGGVDYDLLEQMVNNTLAGMNLEGLNEAQVRALITAAVDSLPDEADVQGLIAAALAELPTGTVDEAAVNALIDAKLTTMGPAIQQAVASQVGKLTDRVTFNVTTAGDGQFAVETNNLTSAQHKVGIDFRTQRDGEVTINGKRVLTVDDALATGSVDTTTLTNQLLMLQSRIDDLEAEMAEKVTMANVQGLLTGFATAQQMTALTGRVTDLEGSTALKQARWVTEALTGDTTANATQISNAVAALASLVYVQEQFANFNDLTQADITALAQELDKKADKTQLGVNAAGQSLATQQYVDSALAGKADTTAVEDGIAAAVSAAEEGLRTDIVAVDTALADYARVTDTKVQAAAADLQTMWDTYAEQPGGTVRNFVDFYTNLTAFIPASMQSATVLQQLMDAFAVKANATVADVQANYIQAMGDYVQNLEQWTNQTFGEVVEYIAVEIEALKAAIAALPTGGSAYGEWIAQALTGTLGATLAEVNRAVEALARKTDLAAYAQINNNDQVLRAKSIIVDGIKIGGEGGGVLAYLDDEYGYRLRLIDPGVTDVADAGILVTHLDLQEILAPAAGKGLELVELVTANSANAGRAGVISWKDCEIVNGTVGTVPVQAQVIDGLVQLRGDLKYTYASSGTYMEVAKLPDGVPPPTHEIHFPIYGIESGVSYRVGLCRVTSAGGIQIAAPTGKVTAVNFSNMTWPVP